MEPQRACLCCLGDVLFVEENINLPPALCLRQLVVPLRSRCVLDGYRPTKALSLSSGPVRFAGKHPQTENSSSQLRQRRAANGACGACAGTSAAVVSGLAPARCGSPRHCILHSLAVGNDKSVGCSLQRLLSHDGMPPHVLRAQEAAYTTHPRLQAVPCAGRSTAVRFWQAQTSRQAAGPRRRRAAPSCRRTLSRATTGVAASFLHWLQL